MVEKDIHGILALLPFTEEKPTVSIPELLEITGYTGCGELSLLTPLAVIYALNRTYPLEFDSELAFRHQLVLEGRNGNLTITQTDILQAQQHLDDLMQIPDAEEKFKVMVNLWKQAAQMTLNYQPKTTG